MLFFDIVDKIISHERPDVNYRLFSIVCVYRQPRRAGIIVAALLLLWMPERISMIQLQKEQKEVLKPLFAKLNDSLIISCIQNYFGDAWVDDILHPETGQIVVEDYCFLAGKPRQDFVKDAHGKRLPGGMTIICDREEWFALIEEEYREACERRERYAIKKEGDIFDREKLKRFVAELPEEYELRRIGEDEYSMVMAEDWSRDFCRAYRDWEDFQNRGMGVVILHQGEVVAGASSYTSYREGIEIEIITREDYRRKGLALVSGSQLVLDALERGLYPNWDAANMTSVDVATRLGYHYDKPYVVYEIIS